jgi:tetratricopeptide (TPR) repeat protein
MSSLGRRLKRLRLQRGLTQRALAEPHYTHAYVSTIEAERRQPSPAALAHFASKLGVEVEELVSGRAPDLVPRLELELQEARVALSTGRSEEADSSLKRIAREAKRYSLSGLHARAEEGRGLCAERLGSAEVAIEHYENAERILADSPPTSRVNTVAGKARCLQMLGDVRYSIHLLEDFLETLDREDLRDPSALVKAHSALVGAYFEAGLYKQAETSATRALSLAPRVEDPARLAMMHMNVARVFLHKGRKSEATESLKRAGDLFAQLELRMEMGYSHLARGYVLSREENFEASREQLTRARSIFRECSAPADEARALTELGRVERMQGHRDAAISLLQQSKVLVKDRDTPEHAVACRELGMCLAPQDPLKAEKHLRLAVELFERCGEPGEAAATYRALGDLFAGNGDQEAACDAYRTGILTLEERP